MNTRGLRAAGVVVVTILAALVVMCTTATAASLQCVDFEDLQLGQSYTAGDSFFDSGVQVMVEQIIAENGKPWYGTASALVVKTYSMWEGGYGMALDPAVLRFDFPQSMSGLILRFQEDGVGYVNLEINGSWVWAQHLADLNHTGVGGVVVTVYGGGTGEPSVLRLDGGIDSFAIGGFELTLDNVCPVMSGPSIFYTDGSASTGAVYEYRDDIPSKTTVYTRTSGSIASFAFAPWDPDRLYFVERSGMTIYEVALDSPFAMATPVLNNTTFIRDIAFDASGTLYFSESSGAGADGLIWEVQPEGGPTPYLQVPLAAVDGFWAGDFAFDTEGTVYLSSGNTDWAEVYRVDPSSGAISSVYGPEEPAIVGLVFSTENDTYFSDDLERVYSLNLETGVATQVLRDTSMANITDVQVKELGTVAPVSGGGLWVMPYGISSVRFDQIDDVTGLIDYTDTASGLLMENAPFGGTLKLRQTSAGDIPTNDVYYYRWQYRLSGETTWNDLVAPVNVHYVKNRPYQTPVFPLLQLGPEEVNSMFLYRFRPHESELSALVTVGPGETVEWPKLPLPGDSYRGYLSTNALPAGLYDLRFEVYDRLGVLATPGTDYELYLPDGLDAGGELQTVVAPVTAGGTELVVGLDNRACSAGIAPPVIGGSSTDSCGFVRYDSLSPGAVELAWSAWQPAGHGIYKLGMVKGLQEMTELPLVSGPAAPLPFVDEVGSTAHNGTGTGAFSELSPTVDLLDGCNEAAYSIQLYVYAKATTGNGYRITSYDASDVVAFAVAPE